MRILFCTDGSKISFNALKNFSHFAPQDAIIDTICVIDWSFLPDDTAIEGSGFANSCRNIADTILEQTKQLVEELGLRNGEQIKYCGAAVESILEQLDENIYTYVILGSHGKKGLQRWLGSVSREILESTSVPVYISKERRETKNILFTTDGSETSLRIANDTIHKLNLSDCKIYICTVVENPDLLFLDGTLDSNWMLAIQAQQEIYSNHAIEKIRNFFEKNNLPIEDDRVLSGIPAQKILNYATEQGIDLIIMGSKIKTKMQSFLLDSVSKRVIEHANCDTLVIKFKA